MFTYKRSYLCHRSLFVIGCFCFVLLASLFYQETKWWSLYLSNNYNGGNAVIRPCIFRKLLNIYAIDDPNRTHRSQHFSSRQKLFMSHNVTNTRIYGKRKLYVICSSATSSFRKSGGFHTNGNRNSTKHELVKEIDLNFLKSTIGNQWWHDIRHHNKMSCTYEIYRV